VGEDETGRSHRTSWVPSERTATLPTRPGGPTLTRPWCRAAAVVLVASLLALGAGSLSAEAIHPAGQPLTDPAGPHLFADPARPANWTFNPSSPGTSVGYGPMTYDAADGYLLLYAISYVVGTASCSSNQLWAYVDGNWSQRILGSGPLYSTAALAYDAYDGYVVFFGGCSTDTNQTWTYHAGHWTNLTSAVAPPARIGETMAFDPALNAAVLFGGYVYSNRTSGAGYRYNDTWEFQGGTWRNVTTAVAPPSRDLSTMAFDSTSDELLLFGGSGAGARSGGGAGCCGTLGDTWMFNGDGWHNETSAGGPSPRESAALSDYPIDEGAILFGGQGPATGPGVGMQGPYFNDTWLFSDGSWSNITAPDAPPPRAMADLAYDPLDDQLVLFGGEGPTSMLADTWALISPAHSGGMGSGAGGFGNGWLVLIVAVVGIAGLTGVLLVWSRRTNPDAPGPGRPR
jgi:hypothetical protein